MTYALCVDWMAGGGLLPASADSSVLDRIGLKPGYVWYELWATLVYILKCRNEAFVKVSKISVKGFYAPRVRRSRNSFGVHPSIRLKKRTKCCGY